MRYLKNIFCIGFISLISSTALAGWENSNKTIIYKNDKSNHVFIKDNKHHNNTTIIRPNQQNHNTTIIRPNRNNTTVIVKDNYQHNTVIVNPKYKKWYRPHVPKWNRWNGHKVVIIDHYHHHHYYDAFRFAMGVIGMAIVVDQITEKPYTEKGDEVIVEEIKCKYADSGHTQVVEASDKIILLVCE